MTKTDQELLYECISESPYGKMTTTTVYAAMSAAREDERSRIIEIVEKLIHVWKTNRYDTSARRSMIHELEQLLKDTK